MLVELNGAYYPANRVRKVTPYNNSAMVVLDDDVVVITREAETIDEVVARIDHALAGGTPVRCTRR